MKRALLLGFIGLFMLAVISGCGSKDTRDFSIENHNWVFSNMVSGETGDVVACGEAVSEQYPEVQVLNLSCAASTNVLTIRDENGNGLEFSYRASGKDTNSLIYELVYQNGEEAIKGMAVSSITEYAKGAYEHTLVMDIDGYAVYFYDRETEKE